MSVNGCLRLNPVGGSGTSYLLVWRPEFSLHAESAKAQILDGYGQVVASLGEEVYVSGGEVSSVDLLDESVRQQLPPGCPGPFWMVGLEVRPNIRAFSELVTLDAVEAVDGTVFFIRAKPGLDERAMKEAPLRGRLALFDRCLRIVPDDLSVNYTPIWLPDYHMRLQEGDLNRERFRASCDQSWRGGAPRGGQNPGNAGVARVHSETISLASVKGRIG